MEALGIDIKLIIAQVVNFAIFFFIFSKYLAKPVMKIIKKQKANELEKDRILQELQTKEEVMQKKYDDLIKKANNEAIQIIAEAKKLAVQARENEIEQTQKDLIDIKTKAEEQLRSEKEAMYKEVKNYIVQTSSDITKKVLKEFLNEADQKKIIDQIEKKVLA